LANIIDVNGQNPTTGVAVNVAGACGTCTELGAVNVVLRAWKLAGGAFAFIKPQYTYPADQGAGTDPENCTGTKLLPGLVDQTVAPVVVFSVPGVKMSIGLVIRPPGVLPMA
jgi:hypothetical protein